MMDVVINLLHLLFFSIFTILVFHYLAEKKINYIKHFLRISILHILVTCLVVCIFYNTFLRHLPVLNWKLPMVFILIMIVINTIYFIFKRFIKNKIVLYHQKSGIYTSSLSSRYTISKSCNVLFQQTLILASIYTLLDMGLYSFQIVLLFAVAFGVAHIFLVDKKKPNYLLVVIASFFGGGIFSFLILFFPYGFIYSYILHWLLLTVIGIMPHFFEKAPLSSLVS